jgi:hypothetical protein
VILPNSYVEIKVTYADYLQQIGVPIFYGADIYWQIYQKALIPASPVPTFVDVDIETSRRLLTESGVYLIRWSSDPSSQETSWWWIVCDDYDLVKLTSKMRNQIKHGHRDCMVRRISAEWLAECGYECYKKAFDRYRNATPSDKDKFKSRILRIAGYETLFENWGVFIGDQLVAYQVCGIEDKSAVSIIEAKYDPDCLKYYPAYAMMDTLLTHYVAERKLPMSNGTRAVSHDTNMQDFLLKFGYRRQYCRLNVMYQPYLKLAISCLYPFRKFVPNKMHRMKALLLQEELRRECQRI